MPTSKKRINLSVPDMVYARLQAYKAEVGVESDATACMQLIVQQLTAHENTKAVLKMVQDSSIDQLMQLSKEGYTTLKELADKKE